MLFTADNDHFIIISLNLIMSFTWCLGEKYLHVMVNNAGTMCHPRKKSEDGFEIHFQTNYLGKFVANKFLWLWL